MHISEIGLCSGHSASGVWVNEKGETTVPGLYAAGDMACVPHNYLLGALTYGKICAQSALDYLERAPAVEPLAAAAVDAERERILAPSRGRSGVAPHQYEYKVRRLGERLSPAAQDGEQDDARARVLPAGEGGARGGHRGEPPRAHAGDGVPFHPRLRGDGGARVAVPDREPLGPLPLPARLPRDGRPKLVHARAPEEGRARRDGRLQEAGGALSLPDRRRRARGLPPAAHAGRGAARVGPTSERERENTRSIKRWVTCSTANPSRRRAPGP